MTSPNSRVVLMDDLPHPKVCCADMFNIAARHFVSRVPSELTQMPGLGTFEAKITGK